MDEIEKALVERLRRTYIERYSPAQSSTGVPQPTSLLMARSRLFNPDGEEAADMIEAQAAEIARLRAGIAEVKARGVAMQNDAYTDADEMHGWGWECAGEWLEAFAQETQP